MKRGRMLFISGLFGFLAVSFGAFGAHGLEGVLSSKQLSWWETATLYLLVHSVLQYFVSYLVETRSKGFIAKRIRFASYSLLVGNVFFAGSLYTMALTNWSHLGMVTPFGGLGYLFGWGFLAFAKKPSK